MIARSLIEIAEEDLHSAQLYLCVLMGGDLVYPKNGDIYLHKAAEFCTEATSILTGNASENAGNISDVEGIEDEEPVEMVEPDEEEALV